MKKESEDYDKSSVGNWKQWGANIGRVGEVWCNIWKRKQENKTSGKNMRIHQLIMEKRRFSNRLYKTGDYTKEEN